MPDGAVVELLGTRENGFESVRYNGIEGWAYGAYLATGSGNANNPPAAGNTGGATVWPISGGEWEICQGYNGPYSHYNRRRQLPVLLLVRSCANRRQHRRHADLFPGQRHGSLD